MDNQSGTSESGRKTTSPPRTLPNHLDGFPLPVFDQRQIPFSPTSPGKRSPGRPRTMKDYEEDVANLKKENFNLKVRIYFLEQHRMDPSLPKDVDELRHLHTTLKVEHDLQKKDLDIKENLLLDTYKALDAQKQELEAVQEEKNQLRCRIENLEKELKDYHQRFMETSVPQLDDTNALYTMTFGFNTGAGPSRSDPLLEEKVVQKLQAQLQEMEVKLKKILDERDQYEGLYTNASSLTTKLEKNLKKRIETSNEKEAECEKWKCLAEELRKQLTRVENQLQEIQETNNKSQTEKLMKLLYTENEKLKQEVKYLQHQLEKRTSRGSSSEQAKEQAQQLKEAQQRQLDLVRENETLKAHYSRSKRFIQTMFKEKKQLQAELDELKGTVRNLSGSSNDPLKEEVSRLFEEEKEMSANKSTLISELQAKIEELTQIVTEKDSKLQELRDQIDSQPQPKCDSNLQFAEDSSAQQCKENEILQKELQENKKEIENLKKELKKKTFNLQGLVNKELWDKNREIEKLNKFCERQHVEMNKELWDKNREIEKLNNLCERQHVEMLSLEKQLRESHLTSIQDKVSSFNSPVSFQRGVFDDKENLQPITESRVQIQRLIEDKRQLQRKVEELQARLLNTPERDKESEQIQTLREEKEAVEKQRKEAVNACVLLTTRLQELADFLESQLPYLCRRKRKYVEQAVERSRELSRSLTLAAEESSLLQCSMWTDLQPSLVVPLLPDISTVDFWSGDEEEPFSAGEEASKVQGVTKHSQEKSSENNPFLNSFFSFDEKSLLLANRPDENPFYDIADITEGSLVETCSDQTLDKSTRVTPEVKSANIGKITLTSKKKESITVEGDVNRPKEQEGISECETWSEPDRDVSYARMGLKEDPAVLNKSTQFGFGDTSETADSVPKSPLSRRGSEIQRLQRKIRSLEQVNAALHSELVILHKLTPSALTRQDKATSIELSRQSTFPSHLLEEIRNQREKLEASLFHNDYIRRQLESTVSSLQKNQGEQDKTSIAKLKEVTTQLEATENLATELKTEKESLRTNIEFLETALQKTADDLKEKQQTLEKLEADKISQLNEIKEKYLTKLSQTEQKCLEAEKKALELEKQNSELSRSIASLNDQIGTLMKEIENHVIEGRKNKQLNDELNIKLQQINRQKDELQRLTAEQEQLLADAERERQELATQLIARDREVSELSKRLSNVELTSGELEAALRSQLDLATQQCAQFEAKIRDLDCANKRREADLQRRLDATRFAHSEALLQCTKANNDNIRLQQELRTRQFTANTTTATNQMAHVERIKGELERRVAELEAVNTELEGKLASLNILRHPMSDYETDAGSSVVGSPRRTLPPPLTLPSSPTRPPPLTSPARSHDLTSDYLSDQEAALSSPQSAVRGLWYPTSPHSHMSASPDLGIESDHGRFSSLETQTKSTAVSLRGTPVKDLMKLEEENTQLRLNLQKTRHALEETLSQLTAANQHKRQYEAQLSAASQHKAKVERAICRQLHKTHSILKKARVNLEEDGKSDRC